MPGFYVSSNLPEIFRIADEEMARRHPQPEVIKKPIKVPVPEIKRNYGAEGPLKVTKKWYVKKKQKKMLKRIKSQREAEFDMIQLIARKEMLQKKLSEFDIGKKKDARKIASYNVEIKKIEGEISQLEMMYDISSVEIDQGTRVGRFLARCKKKVKSVGKKVKKFCKKNAELLTGLASIILPVIGSCIIKAIFHV